MLNPESQTFARLRLACVLIALPLLRCTVSGESFTTPTSGETQAGAGPLSAGAASIGDHVGGTGAGGGPATAGAASSAAGAGGSDEGDAGSAGRGGSGSSPACTGKPGTLRGKSDQMLTAAGLERTFIYYAPPNLDPNVPAPVVIVAHGWTMSGQQMYDITRYHQLADSEGFVLMYPDGQPAAIGPWNVGQDACPSSFAVLPNATGDDQAFIDAMLDFAEADQCLAHEHVFVTGFSMGGYFANETGCMRRDVAAIAPHSGGSHDFGGCANERKPVILFHGTADIVIPLTCGNEARDRWVQRNGCGTAVDSVDVLGGHCEYSKDCPEGGQVALCLFDGMGHGWAGGAEASFSYPEVEPAAQLAWQFFKEHAW
ncbi:MAG TPA: PHB depolymerase family esterase [Polyangiaceae bacterium]|nr:PHB depolymerase family esterase [Polyangiaceae bacterium]